MISPDQTPAQDRVPVRSLILNISPSMVDIAPIYRLEILRELKLMLRRISLQGGRLVDSSKGVSIVWAWGDCTGQDKDLSSPAEVSGILAGLFKKKSQQLEAKPPETLEGSDEDDLLQDRSQDPAFRDGIAKATGVAYKVMQICEDLSEKPHDNAAPSWKERFGLKAPLACRFGLCHGKLFNVGSGLSGLSLDVAADMARMAPRGGLACGPIVKHVLDNLLEDPEAILGMRAQAPTLDSIDMQLIPSAQIECPMWELRF